MARVILDTSAAIAMQRGLKPALAAVAGQETLLPAVVLAELLTATWLSKDDETRQNRRRLTQTLEDLSHLIEFGAREAEVLAELRAHCIKSGAPRSDNDLMIAAHAIAERATLVSADRKARFEQLPGLLVEYV
ncbi:MAG: hypothetical protein RL605_484 [Actinomycetota bacterium]|jgi:predicted nucleic acid-binding protein